MPQQEQKCGQELATGVGGGEARSPRQRGQPWQRPGGEASVFFLEVQVFPTVWVQSVREEAEVVGGEAAWSYLGGRGALVCGWGFILLVKAALLQCHGCSHQFSAAPARALTAKKASRGAFIPQGRPLSLHPEC